MSEHPNAPLPVYHPRTVWTLRGIPGLPHRPLNVRVVVDTRARMVVDAIEAAAERQGLILEREEE